MNWTDLENVTNDAVFSVFGEPLRIVANGEDTGEFIGTFRPDGAPVNVGGDANRRPAPTALIRTENALVNMVGGRLHARGKVYPIVRAFDRRDGTMDVELGLPS